MDHNEQLKRLIKRDSLQLKDAELKINAQLNAQERKQRADVIINNDGED